MAFFVDSPLPGASLLLAAARLWFWRAAAGAKPALRLNLRFAVALLMVPAALGAAEALLPALAGAAAGVAGLVTALAATALALGFAGARPAPAWVGSLALCCSLAAGLFSLLSGITHAVVLAQLAAAGTLSALLLWNGLGSDKVKGLAAGCLIAAAGLALAEQAQAGGFSLLAAALFVLPLKPPVEVRRSVQGLSVSGAGFAGHGIGMDQNLT